MPTETAGTSFVGGWRPGRVRARPTTRRPAWAFVEFLSASRRAGHVVPDGERPARGPRPPGTTRRWLVTTSWRPSANNSRTPKSPPAIPTWEQVAAAIDGQVEAVTVGDTSPEDGCAERCRRRPSRSAPGCDRIAPARASRRPACVPRKPPPGLASSADRMESSPSPSWSSSPPSWRGRSSSRFFISFTDMRVPTSGLPLKVGFVGLDNYVDTVPRPDCSARPRATPRTSSSSPCHATIGWGGRRPRPQPGHRAAPQLFRIGYFLPFVTSIIAVAVVWRLSSAPMPACSTGVLGSIGIDGPGLAVRHARYAPSSDPDDHPGAASVCR